MKHINKWTKKDFRALPQRNWEEDISVFDSLVILPTKTIHDSGYQCMDFVAVKNGIPICRLSGCSDVLHIDGIGGGGKHYDFKSNTNKAWSIDCLAKSGLLQVFLDGHDLEAGFPFSSFEVFGVKKIK